MIVTVRAFREWVGRGPNQIALSTAIRGMLATAAPLIVLPPLGFADLAHLAVVGALGVSMIDVGGPYRRRLVAMAVAGVLGPSLLIAGLHVGGNWWLAALVMAVLALGSGLVRALGPGGVSFGINMAVAFLVGAGFGAAGGAGNIWAAGYFCGAVWTILVTLAFWQVRPYRRLEQEVAGAWQGVADLVAAIRPELPGTDGASRRRREQLIEARHRAARDAIERAHDTVGEARAGTSGFGLTMAQLVVLIASASRVGAAAVTVSEIGWTAWTNRDSLSASGAAVEEIERICRDVAKVLLFGKGELDLEPVRRRINGLLVAGRGDAAGIAAGAPRAAVLAFAQALRNVENADEALRVLRDQRRRLPNLGRLATQVGKRTRVVATVRRQLSFKSAIFRHALRVAAVTGPCTALIVRYGFTHGIWLPMTALIVLQPDYGGTINRALQRSAGTVVGSIIASILLVTLRGTFAFELAVIVLLFATFFLIRRHYGQAIAFLTPLIILLVGFSSADPWIDLIDRVVFTLAGAATALVAGYVLWPQWEHERLPDRLAVAIGADRRYLLAVLDALAEAAPPTDRLGPLRRAAEIEVTNVDAAFQRMVAEPSRQRGRVGKLFMLAIYAHRLCRHTIALEAQIGAPAVPKSVVGPLRDLIAGALEDIALALAQSRAAAPRPAFDEPLAQIRDVLGPSGVDGSAIDLLLGQTVSDITALNTAASAAADAGRPG